MYNVTFPGLGLEFDINPIAFGNVRWYGVIIACGLLLAVIYGYVSAPRFNVDKEKLLDCVIVGVITGIIGARLYYVAFRWEDYSGDLIKILKINEGGLAIYGGIIGGLLGGSIVAKIRKVKISAILDVAVLGFLIGQGVGRWGNFFNQEAFGTTTDLPWGMVSINTNYEAVHPCFLYESLWCLLGFVLIHFLSKKFQQYSGQVFYTYLVWYGLERAFVEGLRTDSLPINIFGLELRVSQILSIIIFIVGIVLLIINRKRKDVFYDNYRREKGIGSGKRASS